VRCIGGAGQGVEGPGRHATRHAHPPHARACIHHLESRPHARAHTRTRTHTLLNLYSAPKTGKDRPSPSFAHREKKLWAVGVEVRQRAHSPAWASPVLSWGISHRTVPRQTASVSPSPTILFLHLPSSPARSPLCGTRRPLCFLICGSASAWHSDPDERRQTCSL
jgi:hypothetical protein